ncbi:hypothetical protein VPNG_02841 [Cytospora leucostoma]|uniref:Uncharacterized protein n=1 Tax=Cytospora leucostoma TaxID=1230097 RepID=A0A423XK96_9PEZI|nr:hypothetical protein VPNG_02841 [Cytospora leucostoma]
MPSISFLKKKHTRDSGGSSKQSIRDDSTLNPADDSSDLTGQGPPSATNPGSLPPTKPDVGQEKEEPRQRKIQSQLDDIEEWSLEWYLDTSPTPRRESQWNGDAAVNP